MNAVRDILAGFGLFCAFSLTYSGLARRRQKAEMKSLVASLPDADLDNIDAIIHDIIQDAMDAGVTMNSAEARAFVNAKLKERTSSTS
jgi:hypothetical protein